MSKSCTVMDCERPLTAKGLCHTHYYRMRKYGDPQADIPVGDIEWRGTSHKTKQGYLLVKSDHPNSQGHGWILEHRLVMAKSLGRPLRDDETVHHRNGVRHDNRLENLELRVIGDHPAGTTIEDRVEHAIATLQEYAPTLLHGEGQLSLDQAQIIPELAIEMNRFRGRMLGLIESFGLKEVQERACKSTIKSLSYDAQERVTALLEEE